MLRAIVTFVLVLWPAAAQDHARNVVLFLADAGGIPTVNAASLLGYNAPQKLFIQSWPNIALSDTTAASQWVTDSAAGMTALVTGRKTHNGVISQGPDAVRGQRDGAPLKTILEYAEERGLATGVISNMPIADATPAACYAHANDRRKLGDIFLQVFQPRFGDGVDILFGPGRAKISEAVRKIGGDFDEAALQSGRPVYSRLTDVPAEASRALAVVEGEFDLAAAARTALQALSRDPDGFFLMIESDAHTSDLEAGLTRLIRFDKLIREIAETVNPAETLLIFTADHSFDLRVHGGGPGEPLLKGLAERQPRDDEAILLPFIRVDDDHTGEEVVVSATGPGAERVRGFLPNTEIFQIMMAAYGWEEDH